MTSNTRRVDERRRPNMAEVRYIVSLCKEQYRTPEERYAFAQGVRLIFYIRDRVPTPVWSEPCARG
jgi:hypothetical protein